MIRKFGATGIDSQPQGLDLGFGGGNNIKSNPKGTLSLTAASQTVTIPAVDITKAIVKISFNVPISAQLRSSLVSAVITNSTTLTFAVNFYSSPIDVSWEVIEFNNVKSLQTGTKLVSADSTSVAIGSVDMSKSVIFFSFTTDDSSNTTLAYGLVDMYINSATTLSILNHAGGATKTIKWQVIEFE